MVRMICKDYERKMINRCNEEKHEAECSWCVFMKSGPCVKSFTKWQSCVADVRLIYNMVRNRIKKMMRLLRNVVS